MRLLTSASRLRFSPLRGRRSCDGSKSGGMYLFITLRSPMARGGGGGGGEVARERAQSIISAARFVSKCSGRPGSLAAWCGSKGLEGEDLDEGLT